MSAKSGARRKAKEQRRRGQAGAHRKARREACRRRREYQESLGPMPLTANEAAYQDLVRITEGESHPRIVMAPLLNLPGSVISAAERNLTFSRTKPEIIIPDFFPVTDDLLDAPDGARLFIDDFQDWYERHGSRWVRKAR